MSGEKELLLSLPLDNKEREWMKERLRTLSVREEYQLAAAVWRSDRLSRLASQGSAERMASVLRQKPEDLVKSRRISRGRQLTACYRWRSIMCSVPRAAMRVWESAI